MKPWVHLFGNWKWTGPADLVLSQVAGIRRRTSLLLGPCPHDDLEHAVATKAEVRGIDVTWIPHLSKHWHPVRSRRAANQLREQFEATPPEVIHAHLDGDHFAAWSALRSTGGEGAMVRTIHAIGPMPARRRRLLREAAHLVITPTRGLARDAESELGWRRGEIAVLEPAVDLEKFRWTAQRRERGRQRLGLSPDAFVVGIVARVQRHRRFELLLEAWKRFSAQDCPPHLLILGRGTHATELVDGPVREHGLGELVHRPGYQEGEDYLDALASCDAGLYLVPGSDITCRASREWMAMGRGVLATRRPPLPEIVLDDQTGLLFDDDPDAIVAAFDPSTREERWSRLGEQAARWCHDHWAPTHEAEQLDQLYRTARLARPHRRPPRFRPLAAIAVARPGWLAAVRAWAEHHEIPGRDVLLLNPTTSRDAVLDLLALRRSTGVDRILLAPSGDWDRTLIDELRRQRSLRIDLLETGDAPAALMRWFSGLVDERWEPPSSLCPLDHVRPI